MGYKDDATFLVRRMTHIKNNFCCLVDPNVHFVMEINLL